MKTLFWTDGFWPRTGGIETQALHFIKGMQQRGHEYRVFAQQDSPNQKEHELYEGISIRRFDFRLVQQNLKYLRAIQDELQQVVNEFQPDMIHLNASSGLSVLVFLLIKQIFCAPIILTLHAPFFYAGQNPVLERVIAISDQVYCVSKWVLDQARKLVPTSAHKLELIYNGLPLPKITPAPLPFSPPVLLLLGRLVPEKGFDTAIQAFSLFKKSGLKARLIIAGGGQERLFLERLVDQLELKNEVQFTGELPREQGLNLINQSTLMMIPSYFEPFGLVAIEAMHMKRPVIASCIGGLQEIIREGTTGLLVPPCDPIALYNAIQTLITQPNMAVEMGLNGYRRSTEQFTLEQNVIAYEKTLKLLRREPSSKNPSN